MPVLFVEREIIIKIKVCALIKEMLIKATAVLQNSERHEMLPRFYWQQSFSLASQRLFWKLANWPAFL